MEKVKYIVKGLGAVLAGVGLMLALGYGLVAIGKLLGLEAEHVTGGVVVLIALGMMVFWLSEDYELKKLKNK
jgi:high-affinity Fe2+/Pb2+ permease